MIITSLFKIINPVYRRKYKYYFYDYLNNKKVVPIYSNVDKVFKLFKEGIVPIYYGYRVVTADENFHAFLKVINRIKNVYGLFVYKPAVYFKTEEYKVLKKGDLLIVQPKRYVYFTRPYTIVLKVTKRKVLSVIEFYEEPSFKLAIATPIPPNLLK